MEISESKKEEEEGKLKIKNTLKMTEDENSDAKKKFIFKKINVKTNTKKKFKGKTKNVVKNFVKAFLKHIKYTNKDIYTKLKELSGQTKFNNTLILRMVQDMEIGPSFKEFLETKAEKWIR